MVQVYFACKTGGETPFGKNVKSLPNNLQECVKYTARKGCCFCYPYPSDYWSLDYDIHKFNNCWHTYRVEGDKREWQREWLKSRRCEVCCYKCHERIQCLLAFFLYLPSVIAIILISWMKILYIFQKDQKFRSDLPTKTKDLILQEEQYTFLIELFFENLPQFGLQFYINYLMADRSLDFKWQYWASLVISIIGLIVEAHCAIKLYEKGMI